MTQTTLISTLQSALSEFSETEQKPVYRVSNGDARMLEIEIPFMSYPGTTVVIGQISLRFVRRLLSIVDPSGSSVRFLWKVEPEENTTCPVSIFSLLATGSSSWLRIMLPTQEYLNGEFSIPIGTVPVWFIKQVVEEHVHDTSN